MADEKYRLARSKKTHNNFLGDSILKNLNTAINFPFMCSQALMELWYSVEKYCTVLDAAIQFSRQHREQNISKQNY